DWSSDVCSSDLLVVTMTAEGAQPLIDFAAQQRVAGVDARVVSLAQARELEPWLNPDITAAVYYPEDCQVQPTIATVALLAAARRRGAVSYFHHEVTGLITGKDGRVTGVRTDRADIPAA